MKRLLQSSPSRCLAAGTAFVIVLLVHLTWINVFPKNDPAQDAWLTVPAAKSAGWLDRYIVGEHYWMGYAYALSISFAVYALLRFASTRVTATGCFAIGSIGLSGSLAVFGCFLVGCCGSPMLGVYLSLLGASFLPFAKPLIALITTILISGSWFWLRHKMKIRPAQNCGC